MPMPEVEFEARIEALTSRWLGEVFRENQRMRCRIGVAQQDMAAAERSAVSQQTFGS